MVCIVELIMCVIDGCVANIRDVTLHLVNSFVACFKTKDVGKL